MRVRDLGRMAYGRAFDVQRETHGGVLAARERGDECVGTVLLVEHDPAVITVSRRQGARAHLVADDGMLSRAGVEVCETDRGGDITYHGPGQLVVYPIVDLNRLGGGGLGLHGYMRALEGAVMRACAAFGVETHREKGMTGVWVAPDEARSLELRKIAALGVRVRRWVTMHGLALNVTTRLEHFGLIVPCGLTGVGVTSLERELGAACPAMPEVKRVLVDAMAEELGAVVGDE
ncbi:MAG: lipoyl(octanoyl) transferase LipB [Phycisphaerales bacterium]|nr:lipoyl(octanoyl) transferase LipB [Phycisphaerales bacterium]